MAGDAWNWLSGAASNTWDWISGAATNTWNWLFGNNNNDYQSIMNNNGLTASTQIMHPPSEGLQGFMYEFIEGKKDPAMAVFYTLRRLLYNSEGEGLPSKIAESLSDNQISYDNIQITTDKKTKPIPIDGSNNTIIIENLNINTEDDPEKIKTAFMNLTFSK